MGVRGKANDNWGSIQGKAAVEKNVPAKNIMGKGTTFPIPEAAAGDLAHAESIIRC
ncbi:MAG: hypothetical protein Ct9H300mP27_05860 [Chloroflexota bacterium]|nr:MAG: hypothetical protein Ct9H300mP27_05860 [Chloroflexota bacterium]